MAELLQYLGDVDTQLFLALNGLHNGFWDCFMMIYSWRLAWIPLYASFLYVMLRNFPLRVNLACILLIVIIVTICDQTASTLLKPLVERMRPSNPDNPISPLVHVVAGYRGGSYGFPSSHAANAWGMAFYAAYLARRSKLTSFLVVWAFVMSYSRIYLGVHYVGDILVGIFIGFLTATISYFIFLRVSRKYAIVFRPSEQSLTHAHVPITTGLATIAVILLVSAVMVIFGLPIHRL